MSDLNRAMIIGRLGRDPEIRYTPDGRAVANFSLATTDKWKDKQSGEPRERTEWHRIVAFGRLGEICGEYLSRGRQVFIEGRLRTRSWEKDGVTRYTTEIEATNMQMLGSKSDGMNNGRTDGNYAAGAYSNNSSPAGNRPGNFSSDSASGRSTNYPDSSGHSNSYPDGNRPDNPSPANRPSNTATDPGYPEPSYNNPPDDDIPF